MSTPSGPRPHLSAVPPPAPEAEETRQEAARGGAGRGLRIALGVLAAALVACGIGWFREARLARGLEARVEALASALAGAQAELDARREHLGAVRDGVTRLRGELESLAGLVAQEPGAAADADREVAPPPAPLD